jgi:hypothetical protein
MNEHRGVGTQTQMMERKNILAVFPQRMWRVMKIE